MTSRALPSSLASPDASPRRGVAISYLKKPLREPEVYPSESQLSRGNSSCSTTGTLAEPISLFNNPDIIFHTLLSVVDQPVMETTPDFVKALDIDHARDGEVMLAYSMNGEDLPVLNGFPLRLVVPGYYGTCWVKHLNEITVIDSTFDGFWMKTAYRIPETPCCCVEPSTAPKATIPINRLTVRSFITSVSDDERIKVGKITNLKGIAFDGGKGIEDVAVSIDNGRIWTPAKLGKNLGRYS